MDASDDAVDLLHMDAYDVFSGEDVASTGAGDGPESVPMARARYANPFLDTAALCTPSGGPKELMTLFLPLAQAFTPTARGWIDTLWDPRNPRDSDTTARMYAHMLHLFMYAVQDAITSHADHRFLVEVVKGPDGTTIGYHLMLYITTTEYLCNSIRARLRATSKSTLKAARDVAPLLQGVIDRRRELIEKEQADDDGNGNDKWAPAKPVRAPQSGGEQTTIATPFGDMSLEGEGENDDESANYAIPTLAAEVTVAQWAEMAMHYAVLSGSITRSLSYERDVKAASLAGMAAWLNPRAIFTLYNSLSAAGRAGAQPAQTQMFRYRIRPPRPPSPPQFREPSPLEGEAGSRAPSLAGREPSLAGGEADSREPSLAGREPSLDENEADSLAGASLLPDIGDLFGLDALGEFDDAASDDDAGEPRRKTLKEVAEHIKKTFGKRIAAAKRAPARPPPPVRNYRCGHPDAALVYYMTQDEAKSRRFFMLHFNDTQLADIAHLDPDSAVSTAPSIFGVAHAVTLSSHGIDPLAAPPSASVSMYARGVLDFHDVRDDSRQLAAAVCEHSQLTGTFAFDHTLNAIAQTMTRVSVPAADACSQMKRTPFFMFGEAVKRIKKSLTDLWLSANRHAAVVVLCAKLNAWWSAQVSYMAEAHPACMASVKVMERFWRTNVAQATLMDRPDVMAGRASHLSFPVPYRCPKISPFGHQMIAIQENLEATMGCYMSHRTVHLVWFACMDATRLDRDLHVNIALTGPQSTGKSWIFDTGTRKMCIPDTAKWLSRSTANANQTAGRPDNGVISVYEEGPPALLGLEEVEAGRAGRSNAGRDKPSSDSAQATKALLTSCVAYVEMCVMTETGRARMRYMREMIGVWLVAWNGTPFNMQEAMRSRFLMLHLEPRHRVGLSAGEVMNRATRRSSPQYRTFTHMCHQRQYMHACVNQLSRSNIVFVEQAMANDIALQLITRIAERGHGSTSLARHLERTRALIRSHAIQHALFCAFDVPGGLFYGRAAHSCATPFTRDELFKLQPLLFASIEIAVFCVSLVMPSFVSSDVCAVVQAIKEFLPNMEAAETTLHDTGQVVTSEVLLQQRMTRHELYSGLRMRSKGRLTQGAIHTAINALEHLDISYPAEEPDPDNPGATISCIRTTRAVRFPGAEEGAVTKYFNIARSIIEGAVPLTSIGMFTEAVQAIVGPLLAFGSVRTFVTAVWRSSNTPHILATVTVTPPGNCPDGSLRRILVPQPCNPSAPAMAPALLAASAQAAVYKPIYMQTGRRAYAVVSDKRYITNDIDIYAYVNFVQHLPSVAVADYCRFMPSRIARKFHTALRDEQAAAHVNNVYAVRARARALAGDAPRATYPEDFYKMAMANINASIDKATVAQRATPAVAAAMANRSGASADYIRRLMTMTAADADASSDDDIGDIDDDAPPASSVRAGVVVTPAPGRDGNDHNIDPMSPGYIDGMDTLGVGMHNLDVSVHDAEGMVEENDKPGLYNEKDAV